MFSGLFICELPNPIVIIYIGDDSWNQLRLGYVNPGAIYPKSLGIGTYRYLPRS
jgi:hypothetical protein